MKLRQFVRPECFIPELSEKSREEALRRIVRLIAEKGIVRDENEIYTKLMERELVQSTAVGGGIAIPHCFTEEVADLVIVIARSSAGVDFDSFDGKPTQVIFLLLGNKNEHGTHLKALARIARLVKNTRFVEKIAAAATAEQMLKVFDEEEEKI
jgi:PTS system nitrogen regulatory IIA component